MSPVIQVVASSNDETRDRVHFSVSRGASSMEASGEDVVVVVVIITNVNGVSRLYPQHNNEEVRAPGIQRVKVIILSSTSVNFSVSRGTASTSEAGASYQRTRPVQRTVFAKVQ